MLDTELKINLLLLQYCKMLVADIGDERLANQPLAGVSRPAWILGHLAFSAHRAKTLLGGEMELPAAWVTLFGPGSRPSASRADYASKDELLQGVEHGFGGLRR